MLFLFRCTLHMKPCKGISCASESANGKDPYHFFARGNIRGWPSPAEWLCRVVRHGASLPNGWKVSYARPERDMFRCRVYSSPTTTLHTHHAGIRDVGRGLADPHRGDLAKGIKGIKGRNDLGAPLGRLQSRPKFRARNLAYCRRGLRRMNRTPDRDRRSGAHQKLRPAAFSLLLGCCWSEPVLAAKSGNFSI